MNISLTPKLEQIVQKKVNSGLYSSASEVIREALRAFMQQERLHDLKLKELRKEIAVGIQQADSKKLIPEKDVFKKIRKKIANHK